jgi:hypothetical protein
LLGEQPATPRFYFIGEFLQAFAAFVLGESVVGAEGFKATSAPFENRKTGSPSLDALDDYAIF